MRQKTWSVRSCGVSGDSGIRAMYHFFGPSRPFGGAKKIEACGLSRRATTVVQDALELGRVGAGHDQREAKRLAAASELHGPLLAVRDADPARMGKAVVDRELVPE